MASFETLSAKNLNRPSYEEIQSLAIHLKVRFGAEAASTADYFIEQHQQAGDFRRAQIWRTVSSSIRANDSACHATINRVNSVNPGATP